MNNNTPQQQQKQIQQNMQTGSGLTRYRSAPSSYFTALLNTPPGGDPDADGFGADDFAQLFNPRASSPETQRIFSRFMNSPSAEEKNSFFNTTSSSSLQQPLPPPKHEPDHVPSPPPLQRQRSNDYSSPAMYQNQNSEDNLQNKGWVSLTPTNLGQIKMETSAGGGHSGLIRHSSSPAGLFANINIESEFGGMRSGSGINRNYMGGNNANAEASSLSRFNNNHLDFSSSSRIMDPISEIGGGKEENQHGNEDAYISDYINSWDDPALLSDNFLDDQGSETRNHRPLSHHLSLPKSTSDELTMDKLMQDSVPCKIRAKRGFATHPRSIAERVRRTKISERIRKLQDLVPNMEKQTSTSDMLDLAVDYIKDLQRQVKTLSDNKDQCSCAAKHQ